MVTLRPGQRILNIPSYGVQTSRRAVSVAAAGFLDTFTDTDGTLLTAHVPDAAPVGATWLATINNYGSPSALKIASNAAYQAASGINVGASYIETGLADCIITANLRTISAPGYGGNGIVFRATDNANYWYVDIVTTSALRIVEITSGGLSVRATTAAAGLAAATDYLMTITLSGNSITATVSTATVSFSSAVRATATKHGILSINEGLSNYSRIYDIAVA